MIVKLSYDLRMKLIGLRVGDFSMLNFNDEYDVEFEVNFEENHKLVQECMKWKHQIETYFRTSYDALRIDIGPFVGLWPISVHYKSEYVIFRAIRFDPNRKSWEDWFMIEDVEDPPQFIQEEI